MSIDTRLLYKGAYTSPSGARSEWDYVDVSHSTDLRTAAFDFTGVNGTYVQTNGHSGREFPLVCIFNGDDHDEDAKALVDAITEGGHGRLEHPLYGTHTVAATGSVEQNNPLVTEANQSTVKVVFVVTLGTAYPAPEVNSGLLLIDGLDIYIEQASVEFAESVDVSTTVAKEGVKTFVRQQLVTTRSALTESAGASSSTSRAFVDAIDTLSGGLDALVSTPDALAEAVINTILIPARAAGDVGVQLLGLFGLALSARSLPGVTPSDYVPGGGAIPSAQLTTASNAFHVARLFSMAAVSGGTLAATQATYRARPAAVSASTGLLDAFDALVTWQDNGLNTLDAVDTGAAYQGLQSLVTLSAGYLVQRSFDLSVERRVTLTRPRTIIDLAAELYGQIDERLDQLIDDNDLTGSEILQLPAGAVVVYYA